MRARLVPALVLTLPALAAAYDPRPDLEEGRYLKALAEAEAELRSDPGNALAWAAKSQALTALVRLPEALAAAKRAVELGPGLADALFAQALARAGVAVQQKDLGSLRQISGAMNDLRAALAADPGLAAAWMTLGLGYQQLPGILGGSTRKALECAQKLRRLAPARGDLLQGTVLALDGNWAEAAPCLRSALAAGAGDPEVVYGYLEALGGKETRKALGDREQKRQLAAEARRLLPGVRTRARAVTAICDALLDADQAEEAWQVAKAALPKADAPSLLRLQLGKLAARAGIHLEEGLGALDQVLREPLEGGSGGYGSAHWRRGQVLKALGRIPEARAAADAALRLDPKDGKAGRLRKELG